MRIRYTLTEEELLQAVAEYVSNNIKDIDEGGEYLEYEIREKVGGQQYCVITLVEPDVT